VWPPLDPAALLSRLYADPAFLTRCAGTVLTAAEIAALGRPATRTPRWTAADTVLLDELDALLTGCETFVHVVVDEAQDLSAMQCRAIGRRCPLGSVTVLGDLAQATTPWAPGDWAVSLRHLGAGDAVLRPLTIGYRVPGEVLAVANRLLPHLEVTGVPAARSVRRGADALTFAPAGELAATVAGLAGVPGSIGVIVPDARVDAVLAELAGGGIDAQPLDADADPRVSVAPASAAKGLEFDSVVLLEPEEIVAAEPTRAAGLRRLYVVLTRAVSRLAVLHDVPLPAELHEDPVAAAG